MDGGMRTSSSLGGLVSNDEVDSKSIVTTMDEPRGLQQGPLQLSAGSCKITNLISPQNCGYVYQPCSARGIDISLRFLH